MVVCMDQNTYLSRIQRHLVVGAKEVSTLFCTPSAVLQCVAEYNYCNYFSNFII